MKQIYIFLTLLFLTVFGISTNAQIFKKLKQKVENKVLQKADNLLNKESKTDTQTKSNKNLPSSYSIYDFIPGKTVLFADSLQQDKLGTMPHHWKSGGTGSVVSFPNVNGKWLKLTPFTTYKLDTLFSMPQNGTIEFDILTRSNQLKDLESLTFGFSSDNSVGGYEENTLAKTQIHYWNQEINNSSNDVDLYNSYDFDLKNYANNIMHVSIELNGQNMKVYLDKKKVLDAEMFNPNRKKYFFINLSTRIDNNAEIAISNFTVAK